MKLKHENIHKIDPALQDALRQAEESEIFRVIMILDTLEDGVNEDVYQQEIHPSQFPSREAYRQALVEQRQYFLRHQLSNTLEALKELSLDVPEDIVSKAIVVEGSARNILASLEIFNIRYISLDRHIELLRQ